MTNEQNEKALRLQSTLQEELQPVLAKIDALEQEVSELKTEQKEMKKILQKK